MIDSLMNRPFVRSVLIGLFAATASSASSQVPSDTSASPTPAPVVVALGDSVTAGYGLNPRDKFPAVLQRRLVEEGYPHQVINAGKNGDTTSGALRRLDRALVPDTRILIVALGRNDRRFRTLPEVIESNLSQIIERAQARGAQVLLCDMNAGLESLLTTLADRYHVTLVPSVMADVAGDPDMTLPDGHPNVIGARAIAETIWPYLQAMLAK